MFYLQRKIDAFLDNWKAAPDRLPLIVKGPRQVGKTASVERFAHRAYGSLVEINFVEEPKYKRICDDGYDAASIIKNISLLDPSKRFEPGETLLFFDEVQEFPQITCALKFFKADGRFDVICSGSMLGISYRQIESNSVGYKTDYEMHSLDFEEFLAARGYGADTVAGMLEHVEEARPFSELELSTYRSLFLDYCILGGMPAVVRRSSRPARSPAPSPRSGSSSSTTRKTSANAPKASTRRASSTCSAASRPSSQRRTGSSRSRKSTGAPASKTTAGAWSGSRRRAS